jgi:O-acetylhomoserine (thiol)-lyase
MIRLSVGIEDIRDILADLDAGLRSAVISESPAAAQSATA